jgi:hypothetical protein|tara:strand:- start:470 stop:964 length:495 start_codon:yes stop_codon:yes gene_type:complete
MEVALQNMVLRAKRAKNGRMMYFKDNKLISKARYMAAKSRSKGSRKRSTARRSTSKGRKMAKRMTIPHPSVTGMASGLAIATYLNQGKPGGKGRSMVDSVIKDVTDGQLEKALPTLANNAINLINSDQGRRTLVGAGVVAMAGVAARRAFPNLKLGGTKLYFRL